SPKKVDFAPQIPACLSPVNASCSALRSATHDSGPGWFANPFLYDSFIRYSMPFYPAAPGSTFPLLWPDPFIFGVAPIDYSPVLLLMPFGFHLTIDTLPSGDPQAGGF